MIKKLLLTILLFSALSCKKEAEQLCDAHFNLADTSKIKTGVLSLGLRAQVTIPVVFHVVYNTAEQNISDAKIQSQVAVLNEDFNATNDQSNVPAVFKPLIGNADFYFVLATRDPNGNATSGITRTQTSVISFSSNGNVCFNAFGGKDAWDTKQYLNIWVCNKTGAVGYSTYPWSGNPSSDGIIVKYNYVGRTGTFTNNWNYIKGRTLTHEVGHWLGLIHTWGDAACGDDYVSDTPKQGSPNGSCPAFPRVTTCSPNSSGDMFMNYMDYTYDACRTMFTAQQVSRMHNHLITYRAGILTSLGATPAGCTAPNVFSVSAGTISATITWNSTGAISYLLRYRKTGVLNWFIISSSTNMRTLKFLLPGTTYQYQVKSNCSDYSVIQTFTTNISL